MTPSQSFALVLILPVVCALCVLLGAWIQYRASRGKSPLPTLPQRPAPAKDDEKPEEPRRHKL